MIAHQKQHKNHTKNRCENSTSLEDTRERERERKLTQIFVRLVQNLGPEIWFLQLLPGFVVSSCQPVDSNSCRGCLKALEAFINQTNQREHGQQRDSPTFQSLSPGGRPKVQRLTAPKSHFSFPSGSSHMDVWVGAPSLSPEPCKLDQRFGPFGGFYEQWTFVIDLAT